MSATFPSSLEKRSHEVHAESVRDTGQAYSQFQGWVLTCTWCDFTSRGRTKADALVAMKEHYRPAGVHVA